MMAKVMRSPIPIFFFSKKEKEQILKAVETAEKSTSGEIRVHLVKKAGEDILARAAEIFEKTGMTKTGARNGVLIFFGIEDKRFCILGDAGIHEKVPPGFWQEIVREMESYFREDRFAGGLSAAILKAGEKLAAYFPRQEGDINELSDKLSYS